MAKLSTELHRYFFSEDRLDRVKLADVLEIAGERSFGFLFVLLAFPSALPVPAPGYSIPFGILMLWLAVQLVVGRERPYFFQSWLDRDVPLKAVQGVLAKGLPWLQRIEVLSRPRFSYICTSLTGRVVLGLAIALMSISMMVPIPGTNTLPAMGIFVVGFGLLEDDGLISLSGLVLCAMGGTLSTLILIFGYEAVKAGIEALKNAVF
ncbi:MAG: exopolysaccharide biosynthesis protein [Cyanobacteria bacterium SID2]|nr:exopolysaccharide biosynthesis protein [Cyanobacteria bacterium SID2]MBP0004223.1 exopolysaccharide biosynthesis protein [Cyanobacteria bacterium SBC]